MSPERSSASLASLRGRLAALSLHSQYDSRVLTQPARDRFLERFEDEVDPERRLSEKERMRRASSALKAHMTKLAYLSAKARAARKGSGA